MPPCDFNKAAKQLCWNRHSAWVSSCKFAACFQNTFLQEYLRVAVSVTPSFITSTVFSKHSWQLFPRNLFLELHQGQLDWKQRVSVSKLYMPWIWSYPVSKKELFLKLALPKKQTKLFKTIWSELGFYRNCKL